MFNWQPFDHAFFSRSRRQGWNVLWKRHSVRGVAVTLGLLGGVISLTVPAVAAPILVWVAIFIGGGVILLILRQYESSLPGWARRILFDPTSLLIHGLIGISATGALDWFVLPNGDFQQAIHFNLLSTFFLLPLIYASRYGRPNDFIALLVFALALTVITPLAVLGLHASAAMSSMGGALLLILSAFGAHSSLQTLDEKDARVQRLSKIIGEIANRQDLKTRYDWIAQVICNALRYPVIHIMAWDPAQDALVIKGATGKERRYWKNVRIPRGQGITGSAFETGKLVVCNDVTGAEGHASGYVQPEGYADIKSELAVPLVYRKERLGVLDFQSAKRGEFDADDIAEARLLAKAVALAIKWNETVHTQLLLWETISHAQRSKEMSALIDEILEMARGHLGAAVITFYPLIPETGLPRRAVPYRKGVLLCDESTKGGLDSFAPGMALYRLMRNWKIYFSSCAPQDRMLRARGARADDFINREKIQSVIFIPLGEADHKLGVLFVNYRDYRAFTPAAQAQIRAFGAAFTLAIQRLNERQRATESLRIGVHRNLAKYLYRIKMQMASARDAVASLQEPALDEEMRQLEEAVLQLRSRVLRDTGGIFDLPATSLREALQNAYGSLKPERGTDFIVTVHPEVERLSRWLHAVIYNLTVEALSNAIAHGRATLIRTDIRLNHLMDAVECCTVDNGCGFDPRQVRQGSDGIFAITDWIKRELNGSFRFIPREENGMRVEVSIPILAQGGPAK